jgi:hypothetical protein
MWRKGVKQRELEYHGATAGGKQPKLYQVWSQIKQRCFNRKHKKYPDYGGRGIDMDPRWRESYSTFQSEINKLIGPAKGRSLGRKDIQKGYWPGNIIWRDSKSLRRNTRANHYVEYQGKERTLGEVSEMTGVDHRRLQDRVTNQKMDINEAVELPLERGVEFYEYRGERHKLAAWAKLIGKPYFLLYDRIHKLKWTVEKAFEEPL